MQSNLISWFMHPRDLITSIYIHVAKVTCDTSQARCNVWTDVLFPCLITGLQKTPPYFRTWLEGFTLIIYYNTTPVLMKLTDCSDGCCQGQHRICDHFLSMASHWYAWSLCIWFYIKSRFGHQHRLTLALKIDNRVLWCIFLYFSIGLDVIKRNTFLAWLFIDIIFSFFLG